MSITPDIIIIGIMGLIAAYGILLGPEKIRTLAISAYVGIVLATQLGNTAAKAIQGSHSANSTNGTIIKLVLLILPVLLLELGRRHKGGRHGFHHGLIATLILAGLTGLLLVSSGLHLLTASEFKAIKGDSFLAAQVYSLHLWWVALVPLAVIAEAFIRPKEGRH